MISSSFSSSLPSSLLLSSSSSSLSSVLPSSLPLLPSMSSSSSFTLDANNSRAASAAAAAMSRSLTLGRSPYPPKTMDMSSSTSNLDLSARRVLSGSKISIICNVGRHGHVPAPAPDGPTGKKSVPDAAAAIARSIIDASIEPLYNTDCKKSFNGPILVWILVWISCVQRMTLSTVLHAFSSQFDSHGHRSDGY